MTQPTPEQWDGTGPDPWMPQRLQQQAQVAVGERTIYDDYYARLSAWLVFAGQATMAGVVPDPDAILNLAPRWVQSMTDFVHTSIAEMVGKAYVKVFGPGYRYDDRPYVIDYLARAVNRLVGVPDQAYTLITSQVAEGAMAGESITKIRDRVRESFDVSGTPYWQNRPTVVARTEVASGLNAGKLGAFQEVSFDLGEPFEKGWLATMVGRAALRTRPTHRAADMDTPETGQRVPLDEPFIVGGFPGMFPGAPELPPEEGIQCVPGDTLVSFPGLRAATRRWYEGDLIRISFASGDELSITPNHPVLRADGIWTPAGLLHEGDHCVRTGRAGDLAGTPDEDGGPTQIGEIYRLAEVSVSAKRVTLAPPDLHGDGADGHVDVVSVDRSLRIDGQAASDQEIDQFGLSVAHLARSSDGAAESASVAHLGTSFAGEGLGATLPIGSGREGAAVVDLGPAHALEHGGAAVSDLKVHFAQAHGDGRAGNAKRARDGQDALPPLVAHAQVVEIDSDSPERTGLLSGAQDSAPLEQALLDCFDGHSEDAGQRWGTQAGFVTTAQVVRIEKYAFSGHVYNLDTGEGWYIANSIPCRNCRCGMLILRPGEQMDLSNRQMSDF